MKNKNILIVICFTLLISMIAIGCAPAERPVPETTPNDQNINRNRETIDERNLEMNRRTTDDNMLDNDNNMPRYNQRDMDDAENGDLTDRAEKIANQVSKLKEVDDATVVITENTALVGIDMTSETKGELSADIKKQVEDAVEKADKEIDRVSVTADPDIFTRIENMAKDIGEGRPLSGFGQEIEEIIRRITPGA